MKKNIIILFLALILILMTSCQNDNNIEGLQYEKIEASHLIEDDSISSYLLIKAVPNEDEQLVYNMTFFSDFLKGTGRYYHYYQVDYSLLDEKVKQYYHVFTFEENERKYAQKFAPHEVIDGIKDFDIAIEYEYKLDSEEKLTKTLLYHEDIIEFNEENFNIFDDNDKFVVLLDSIIEEDSNKYKVTINFSDLENGHFDFQAWFKLTSGEVVPFFGVYHYEVKRGSFVTLSYEKLPKDIVIEELYYTLNYYDGLSVSTYNNVVK